MLQNSVSWVKRDPSRMFTSFCFPVKPLQMWCPQEEHTHGERNFAGALFRVRFQSGVAIFVFDAGFGGFICANFRVMLIHDVFGFSGRKIRGQPVPSLFWASFLYEWNPIQSLARKCANFASESFSILRPRVEDHLCCCRSKGAKVMICGDPILVLGSEW